MNISLLENENAGACTSMDHSMGNKMAPQHRRSTSRPMDRHVLRCASPSPVSSITIVATFENTFQRIFCKQKRKSKETERTKKGKGIVVEC
mgnify:CR=1 FL=1